MISQLLFLSTGLLLSFSLLNLDKLLKDIELKIELYKATYLWLNQEPVSQQREANVLVCEDGVLKYCFDKNYCQKVLRQCFHCHLAAQDNLISLRIMYGNQYRDFNYIFDCSDNHYIPNNRNIVTDD